MIHGLEMEVKTSRSTDTQLPKGHTEKECEEGTVLDPISKEVYSTLSSMPPMPQFRKRIGT